MLLKVIYNRIIHKLGVLCMDMIDMVVVGVCVLLGLSVIGWFVYRTRCDNREDYDRGYMRAEYVLSLGRYDLYAEYMALVQSAGGSYEVKGMLAAKREHVHG